jgi:hypothetical protein
VTDIRFSAETLNARCITAIDANIVKHSGFFEKLGIQSQLWMHLCYPQAAISHLTGMN